ncbi:MAG TPA: dipeptidase [Spirochaetia bacterium]|nr:dipeptidase [Spirochaetales bacterium]HOT58196.1 dipeptidase [Spirochaetales bacterium]HPD81113.1 dipeptidase [Spirochaetales bacterium]HQK34043.1 dipeptidase [Spirochaetales bacterium]HRS64498.1 dipeptidase [Spirochaetia bacterium]
MQNCINILDGHNDFSEHLSDTFEENKHLLFERQTKGHLDLPRMHDGRFAGGFFAIFIPQPAPTEELTDDEKRARNYNPLDPAYAREQTISRIHMLVQLAQQSNNAVTIVLTADELKQAYASNTIAMILHIEGAEAIASDLSNLDFFYNLGVRSIGPVWSRVNVFGHGVTSGGPGSPDTGPGLTNAGKELVKACNRMGILVDCSHINEKGFWDIAKITTKPLVATHSCVHAISPSKRNLTDKQIAAIGESHGVIGINFAVHFLREDCAINTDTPLSLIVQHAQYIADRIGVDHVAFGSDFDGAPIPAALKDVSGLPLLIDEFRSHGFTLEEIEKIAYKNWIRILETTL